MTWAGYVASIFMVLIELENVMADMIGGP
jgi:hypothetical protein